MQKPFYNGWTHGIYVTNVFMFFPGGAIGTQVLNRPGAIHYSSMATMGELYKKCNVLFDRCDRFDARGVVDFVFASLLVDFLVKSAKTAPPGGGAEEGLILKEATLVRKL